MTIDIGKQEVDMTGKVPSANRICSFSSEAISEDHTSCNISAYRL